VQKGGEKTKAERAETGTVAVTVTEAKTGTNPGTKKEGGRWGQLQGVISTPEHV